MRVITAGPITRGSRRFTTDGVGEAAPWYGYYRRLFRAVSCVSFGGVLADGLSHFSWLQAAYAARAEANAEAAAAANNAPPPDDQMASSGQPSSAPNAPVALSPEVKQAIAEEVKAQIAAAQADASKTGSSAPSQGGGDRAASGQVPPALDPARRTFVVSDLQ